MIGAFYQPEVVLADTDVLTTLPGQRTASGLGRVIKYGLIRDLPFLEWLEQNLDTCWLVGRMHWCFAIARSCKNKAEAVLCRREKGERALLNLGHTFGHANRSRHGIRRLVAR